jgi:YVTN family beta-propeller protein
MTIPLRWMTAYICFSSLAAELPSPTLLVLNKEESTLTFVDPSTGKVSGRVKTGDGPHEVEVSADGKYAFVSNYGSGTAPGNTLSVVDLPSLETRPFNLAPLQRAHGLATEGNKVWFTAEANKVIGRYDPASNRMDLILGTGQNGTHMVLVSKDANKLYTANIGSDSISIFERAVGSANWDQTVIPVGKGPEGMDLTPDGRQLWAAHSRDGRISIIDVNTKKVTGTIDIGTKRSNRLKFTPDSKYVLVSDLEGGELVILDAASRKQVKRLALGKAPEGILIEPGGKRAFIAVSGDNHIAVLDLNTLNVTGQIQTGRGPDGMAWRK